MRSTLARLGSLLVADEPSVRSSRDRVLSALVVGGATAAVALAWFAPFLADPRILPPGPDLPWYIWRTELLMTSRPEALVEFVGPLQAFGGAYRVANPVVGALLRGTGDVDRFTLSILFVAGWNVLAAVALGAAAYRYRRDPLLFAAVTLFAGGTLLLNPFVGWVDNILALVLVVAALSFLPGARVAWPPRIAVGLLVLVAFFAHPPTAAVFCAAVTGTVLLRILLDRVGGLRAEGPLVLVVGAAALLAFLGWWGGIWGPGRPFLDAVNPPPYDGEYFAEAARHWIRAARPIRFLPLMVAGLAVVVGFWNRFRSEPLPRAVAVWLLPVLGVLGYWVGLVYPYKRFLNVTLAPVLLAGIGTWAVVRMAAGGLRRWRVPAAVLGLGMGGLILATVWADGLYAYRRRADWMWPSVRQALAVTRAYVAEEPGRPVVFIISAGRRAPAEALYGAEWRGNWSVLRAGMPGETLDHTYVYLGALRDLVEWRPTIRGSPTLDLLSRASFRDLRQALDGRKPVVFVVHKLNDELGNRQFLVPGRSVRLGEQVSMLLGPKFAEPDPQAVRAAQVADARVRRWSLDPPPTLARPGEIVVGVLGLAVVLVLPGLLAAPWVGVRGLPMALGVVPALSIALNASVGIAVLGVTRRPLEPAMAWAVAGVAVAIGAGLGVASRLRRRGVEPRRNGHGEARPHFTELVPVSVSGREPELWGGPGRPLPPRPAKRAPSPASRRRPRDPRRPG